MDCFCIYRARSISFLKDKVRKVCIATRLMLRQRTKA